MSMCLACAAVRQGLRQRGDPCMGLLCHVEGAQGIVAGDADSRNPQRLPDATAASLVSLAKPAKIGKAVC